MRSRKNKILTGMSAILTVVLALVCGIFIAGGLFDVALAADIKPVEINETNFPDANFRAVIAGRDYDRDGNGVLSSQEIELTINIHCDGMNIKSLKGIEYFTALQGLYCTENRIETMDLSKNKELRGVWCSDNLFTSLDFTPNPELLWVYCYNCKLTKLNIANNPKMAYVECNSNPLKKIDVTHNPKLEHLICSDCGLTELDLSKNPELSHLDALNNYLKKLDVSHNPKMKRLDIWNNPGLGSIDVSKNPGLQYYNCAFNGATSVDVSKNKELQKLICSYNSIKKLDLSNNPKLVYLDCAQNWISSLDLTNNPQLYFLQAFTNPFTKLNIGDNPFLVKVYKEGKKKAEYAVCNGHSWTLDYGGETSTGGDNILFLCVDDVVKVNTTSTKTSSGSGSGDDVKNTGDLITREAVAQTLYEMAGKPGVKGLKSRFKDVKAGSWYEAALLWGEKNSICVGYPDVSSDNFGVGEYISRQDMTLMLMRYAEYKNYKRAIDFGRTDEFADYYEIDYYAWEAMTWAVTWNIMNIKGDPNAPQSKQRLDPKGKATKADLEYMLKRMLEENGDTKTKIVITDKAEPKPTQDPAKVTQAPAKVTQAPAKVTQAPAKVTQAPAKTTPTPKAGTPTPKESTPTPTPLESTQAPAENTPTPSESTLISGEDALTQNPGTATPKPEVSDGLESKQSEKISSENEKEAVKDKAESVTVKSEAESGKSNIKVLWILPVILVLIIVFIIFIRRNR